jgi:phage shock protein PspC (stress-responsive transcriptional regulator)
MNTVITINLNGRAFQLEAEGYNIVRDYIQAAEDALQGDPGKAEIMADLEQSIAEKFERFLRPSKDVISKSEAELVIQEMGPVEAGENTDRTNQARSSKTTDTRKHFYRIREGAMVGGICTGLAAYFDIDVTLIRVVFVVLLVVTHIVWLVAYILAMIFLPEAATAEQKAEASGAPFTANDLIHRARTEYQKFSDNGQFRKWKQEWRQNARQQREEMKNTYRQHMREQPYRKQSRFGEIIIALLSLGWVVGLISLISKGVLYGFAIPTAIPIWVAALGWFVIYAIIISSLKGPNHSTFYNNGKLQHHHEDGDFLKGLGWLAAIAIILWVLYTYVPEGRFYMEKVIGWANHIWINISSKRWF